MFNAPEDEVRQNTRIPALNIEQDLLVSKILPTKRTMFKDEDVCLHCGLCAERCPTGAWDMQTFLYEEAKVYSSVKLPQLMNLLLNLPMLMAQAQQVPIKCLQKVSLDQAYPSAQKIFFHLTFRAFQHGLK